MVQGQKKENMNIQEIAHRIREEHRKYANKEGMDWAMLAASKIKAEIEPGLTAEEAYQCVAEWDFEGDTTIADEEDWENLHARLTAKLSSK